MAGRAGRGVDRLRYLELWPGPGGGPRAAVRGPAAPQRPPWRVRRREPRHVGAGTRPGARVRADPYAPEAARRDRRVGLADRGRLGRSVDHYDVIIIGTGAGGGTLAHRLAPSGNKILLLERGGYLPRELENWDSKEVFGRERYVTTERWYDKHGVAFRPHAQYFV